MIRTFARWRSRAGLLKTEVITLYFALRHPRTPMLAKLIAGLVVAYALSPIDLIPDFIPVLGYLDDIIILPAGIALVLRLLPASVLAECRARAQALTGRLKGSLIGAALIVGIWVLVLAALIAVAVNWLASPGTFPASSH